MLFAFFARISRVQRRHETTNGQNPAYRSTPRHRCPTPYQVSSAAARRCAVPYGDDMFTTIVVWVVGLTVGYVGLRAIRTRSWSRPGQSED